MPGIPGVRAEEGDGGSVMATHTHYNDPDVELKEAEKMLADSERVLKEAETMRLHGVRIQAQAPSMKAEALEAKENS